MLLGRINKECKPQNIVHDPVSFLRHHPPPSLGNTFSECASSEYTRITHTHTQNANADTRAGVEQFQGAFAERAGSARPGNSARSAVLGDDWQQLSWPHRVRQGARRRPLSTSAGNWLYVDQTGRPADQPARHAAAMSIITAAILSLATTPRMECVGAAQRQERRLAVCNSLSVLAMLARRLHR